MVEKKYFGYSQDQVLDAFHSKKELVPNTPKRLHPEKSTLESLKEKSENLTENDAKYVKKLMASDLYSNESPSSKSGTWKKGDFLPILDEDIEE